MDKKIFETANRLLEFLRAGKLDLASLEAEYNKELTALQDRYAANTKKLRTNIESDEKALKSLMKSNKKDLFDGTDIVSLPAGRLLHETNDKVSLSRDTLSLCKQHGFVEAVKIAESIDRSVLEKWADAKLLLVGGTRKKVESYNYEVKK